MTNMINTDALDPLQVDIKEVQQAVDKGTFPILSARVEKIVRLCRKYDDCEVVPSFLLGAYNFDEGNGLNHYAVYAMPLHDHHIEKYILDVLRSIMRQKMLENPATLAAEAIVSDGDNPFRKFMLDREGNRLPKNHGEAICECLQDYIKEQGNTSLKITCYTTDTTELAPDPLLIPAAIVGWEKGGLFRHKGLVVCPLFNSEVKNFAIK